MYHWAQVTTWVQLDSMVSRHSAPSMLLFWVKDGSLPCPCVSWSLGVGHPFHFRVWPRGASLPLTPHWKHLSSQLIQPKERLRSKHLLLGATYYVKNWVFYDVERGQNGNWGKLAASATVFVKTFLSTHCLEYPLLHSFSSSYAIGELPVKNSFRGLGVVAHACNFNTLGGRGRWIMRSRNRDHPGQHGETPSLLKIQKLAGCGGVRL